MFQVTINSTQYKVNFEHLKDGTRCVINQVGLFGDTQLGTKISEARSFRVATDNPCRKIGRKVSLTRALEPFDKETRKVFWTRYLEVCKH